MIKKITFLWLILASFSLQAQLSEDFESGTFPPTGWAIFDNGIGTVQSWHESGTDNHMAIVIWENVTDGTTAEDWMVTPQFTVDANMPLLAFSHGDFNTPDYGSTFTVRVSTASQTTMTDFTTILTENETQLGSYANTAYVDMSAYAGQAVYVAFVWAQDDGDALGIDNVRMIAPQTAAPDPAINPVPADAEAAAVVDGGDSDGDGTPDNSVTLRWEANTTGGSADDYEVYIGDSATSLSLGGTFSQNHVVWPGRAMSTTYYWKIVPKNSVGSAANCPIWSFTTAATADVKEENTQLFAIYPNPASDILNISSKVDLDNVSIVNQLGQEVLSNDSFDRNTNSFNISSLKKGVYYIKISANTKKQNIRFIKK